jgi:hypothetical protein
MPTVTFASLCPAGAGTPFAGLAGAAALELDELLELLEPLLEVEVEPPPEAQATKLASASPEILRRHHR